MLKLESIWLGLVVATATLVCLASAYYDRDRFKEISVGDDSNDDAMELNTQQLLNRSGFDYEEHFVIAEDGYVTLLVRIVNPLADRTKLKQPPLMMHHGASVDQSIYLRSSSIQHHPEKYPRAYEQDGPITSSNRSLAFTLANNGYDVWLVGTRGSNRDNQAFEEHPEEKRAIPDWRPQEENYKLVEKNRKKYWSYGLDNIIDKELEWQIRKVCQVTGSEEVSIFSFSLSTPTTMAFLAKRPEIARQVRVYIQQAPAIAADHFTFVDKIFFEKLCPYFPTRGIGFLPVYSSSPFVRRVILTLSKSKRVRYSLVHRFLTALFGPSLKYMSNLELNLLGNIWQAVSFKTIQHYCKNSLTKRLTRFDYGKKKNVHYYGQLEAPKHFIGKLDVQNYLVLSGTYDGLADQTTVQRLIETTETQKPATHIIIPGYNHLDFLGGVENDRYVNLPVLAELDKHADIPQ